MENSFCIKLTIKTERGHECFGEFYLGQSREWAESIFQSLKGDRDVDDQDMLNLELTESRHGLPVNVRMMSCDLDELQENTRLITKEVFRHLNLENQ